MSVHRQRQKWFQAQALIEFGLILPIFLLIVMIIFYFGIIFYVQIVVVQAAWEGALAGAIIVDPETGDQEILGAVHRAAVNLDLSRLQVDIDPAQDEPPRNLPYPAPRGSSLTITVLYQLELPPKLLIPVLGKAVARMEYQNP